MLEALSLGTPVIGYEHGGVGEILRRIYPAGLVAAGDLEAVVKRVRELLSDPPSVPPEPAYPLQRMLDQTLALYQEISQRPR